MSEQKTPPSILTQTERIVAEQPDGFRAGVLVQDGQAAAELSAKKDIGKQGGWQLGAVARWKRGQKPEGAAHVQWTGKD
jgi:hypothetical protein